MMKCCIIINGYSELESMMYQPMRLKEELENRNISTDIIRNRVLLSEIRNSVLKSELSDYDFCIYLDKDKYLLRCLEKSNIPVFNAFEPIEICDDKMMTYIELANLGYDVPDTVPGILCYDPNANVKIEMIDFLEKRFGYPFIVKESYGSLGKGVFLVRNRQDAINICNKVKCSEHLFQEYIDSSEGRDVRAIVIGDEVIGSMLRSSDSDFRSNVENGGSATPYPLDDDTKRMCVDIAKDLGLHYCGIDLLFTEDGFRICEVNSNAFFREFEKVTGINVAAAYAEYIIKTLAE